MQPDELAACKVVSLQQPYLPPRSRLYSLRPIGISTSDVESLTGYIARLAAEHCVSVYALLSNELVAGVAHGVDQPGENVKRKRANVHLLSINGVTPFAASWVRVLESLTHRRDLRALTMLAWAEVCRGQGSSVPLEHGAQTASEDKRLPMNRYFGASKPSKPAHGTGEC